MPTLAIALILLVAVLHLYFLVLEMFLWTKPLGLKVFGQSLEKAQASKTLAANQGLYNGFLAAGLVWAVLSRQPQVALFFLGCVVIAGLYGAMTVSRKILFVQALPAAIAIAVLLALH